MAKDYCIEYGVQHKGWKRKCTNYNFLDVLICIDHDYNSMNIVDWIFSIRRAEKIVCRYSRDYFGVEVSQREIAAICYPQKGLFPARAGIILMAMYNLLKLDSEQDNRAKQYIVSYMKKKHAADEEEVVKFFFGDIPDKISEKMDRLNECQQNLWGYYCHIDQEIALKFGSSTWMNQVEKEFPLEVFKAMIEVEKLEVKREKRVYLLKRDKISTF